jgi:hypothetical protein
VITRELFVNVVKDVTLTPWMVSEKRSLEFLSVANIFFVLQPRGVDATAYSDSTNVSSVTFTVTL